MAKVHIVGAGMAGLAAAVTLARDNRYDVALYEAAPNAGGRCRSFHDDTLGCEIDNGNHLMLAGNWGVTRFLERVGPTAQLDTMPEAVFPFYDLDTGERWTVSPNEGRMPWWVFSGERRVPGSRPHDYLAGLKLARAGSGATVEDVLGGNANLYRRFWKPLTIAILNTPPEQASAMLLRRVFAETFGQGGDACRPRIARNGLSNSLVRPAVEALRRDGADIRFGQRLRHVETDGSAVVALDFGQDRIEILDGDAVILALSPAATPTLLPEISAPSTFQPIVNVHFRLEEPIDADTCPTFLGLIGGVAEWVFRRGDVLSITISAAEHMIDESPKAVAQQTWSDVRAALDLQRPSPPHYRIIKEKRATFAQTPGAERDRPDFRTNFKKLVLAGDWTNTQLPATIEGAIRSGFTAAAAVNPSSQS